MKPSMSATAQPRRRAQQCRAAAAALVCTGLVAAGAFASDEPVAPGRIHVSAQGRVQAEPDVVTLRLAIVTEDRRSERASERNAASTQAVLEALRRTAGEQAQIRTTGYALNPLFDYDQKTSTRRLRGYQVRNAVVLRSGDLAGIGRAIDAAADAGANQIDSLEFGVRDDFSLRMQALAQATRRAREKAEAIAAALGREVGRVVQVDEGGVSVPMVRMQAARFDEAASTPVEVGSVDVSASVSLQLELAP